MIRDQLARSAKAIVAAVTPAAILGAEALLEVVPGEAAAVAAVVLTPLLTWLTPNRVPPGPDSPALTVTVNTPLSADELGGMIAEHMKHRTQYPF